MQKQTGHQKRTVAGYLVSIVFLTAATLTISFGSRTQPAQSLLPEVAGNTNPSAAESAFLTEAEHVWAAAHAHRNGDPLRAYLAADFVATDARGNVERTSAYLRSLTGGKPTKIAADSRLSHLDIRVYGPVAVVVGQSKAAGQAERFTHVYHRLGGRWQVVASQATPIKG